MTPPNDASIAEKFSYWLSLLKSVENRGDYHVALCPAHDDEKQSLSTRIGDKGIVANCHAGCKFPKICHALGVTASWTFIESSQPSKPVQVVTGEWYYHDEFGNVLFRTVRMEDGTIGENGKPKKTFFQQSPTKTGGWKGRVKGVRQVPYRLPELLMSSGPVLIVEGEKQVDKLRELGFTATCNAGGAGKWKKEFASVLAGRDVVILPDNDKAGRGHARDVTEKLSGTASSVKIAILPDLPDKGDVMDFVESGGTADRIWEAINNAGGLDLLAEPPPEPLDESITNDPVATEEDRQICEALGIFVYGEDESGKIKVFSRCHRKTQLIRDVNKFYMADFLRLCGPVARGVIYTGEDDKPANTWRIGEVRNAIATLAGYRRVTDRSELGVGVWACKSPKSNDRDSIVMVGAGEAGILNGIPGLQLHRDPAYGDQLFDLSESDEWFDHGLISDYVSRGESWRAEVTEQLEELYGLWAFRDQHVTPALLTGLTLATWCQSIWDWRPQVSISGKSGSGKSTLFGFLAGRGPGDRGLFGLLAIKSSDSSAAGLRQAVRNTSRILICDEIEAGRHRNEIYEMLRNAGRGDETLRGTAGQKATGFSLRHIVWVGATESGLIREPDKNRFIQIELIKPSEGEIGRLQTDLPFDDEVHQLGQKVLAVAVTIARRAKKMAVRLRESKPRGVDHRVIESYVVPAACYAVAMGQEDSEAVETLASMLSTIEDDPAVSHGDEQRVLETILDSIIDVGKGEKATVSEIVQRKDWTDTDVLCRYGMLLQAASEVDHDRKEQWIAGQSKCLFVNGGTVTRQLLRGTEWEKADICQLLKRIPKAIVTRKSIFGKRVRGVLIPGAAFTGEQE